METKSYFDKFLDFAWNYGPKLLSAVVLLVVGLWVIKRLTMAFDVFLRNRKVDVSLRPFFTSLADTGMKIVLLLVVANMIGLETTSFIAIFSAIAFSVGLALQGSLGNFASGVLILLFRPYKIGDLITVVDKTGTVKEIQIFNTILATESGKIIVIPNGKMTEGPIENIQQGEIVQAEVILLINSDTNYDLLRAMSEEVVARCPYTLRGSHADVKIVGISRDDMKVQIACKTLGENYEETMHFLYENLKIAFDAAGINLAKERRREEI